MINTWMVATGLQKVPVKVMQQDPAQQAIQEERKKRPYKKKHDCWNKKRVGAKHGLIIELFKSGASINQIRDQLNTSTQYVKNILFYNKLIDLPKGPSKYCKKKPVVARNDEGKFIGEYETVWEAARETGLSEWSVRQCVSGKLDSVCGFIFEYKDGNK